MGARGPARTPPNLRGLKGTLKPSRIDPATLEGAPLVELPEPPTHLTNGHAAAEWRRLGALLVGSQMLTDYDLPALALLCAVHGDIVSTMEIGLPLKGAQLAQFAKYASLFGMSPAWRSRIRAAGVKEKANPFERFKQPGAA